MSPHPRFPPADPYLSRSPHPHTRVEGHTDADKLDLVMSPHPDRFEGWIPHEPATTPCVPHGTRGIQPPPPLTMATSTVITMGGSWRDADDMVISIFFHSWFCF